MNRTAVNVDGGRLVRRPTDTAADWRGGEWLAFFKKPTFRCLTSQPPYQSAASPVSRRSLSGFTLIELCLAMAMLAVLFSAALPSFASLHSRFQRERFTQGLADCMAYARAGAVADRSRYELRFERSPWSYQLYKFEPAPASEEEPWVPAPGRWGQAKTVPEALEIEAPLEPIEFFPNGSASPARIVVKSEDQTTLVIELAGTLGYAQIREQF